MKAHFLISVMGLRLALLFSKTLIFIPPYMQYFYRKHIRMIQFYVRQYDMRRLVRLVPSVGLHVIQQHFSGPINFYVLCLVLIIGANSVYMAPVWKFAKRLSDWQMKCFELPRAMFTMFQNISRHFIDSFSNCYSNMMFTPMQLWYIYSV